MLAHSKARQNVDEVTFGLYRLFSFARLYDACQDFLGAGKLRRQFIRDYVDPFPGAKVLDIGCGTGRILDYFPGQVDYVGFDANPQYIAHANKTFRGRGRFFCGRVSEAHVPGEGFDFVLAIGILHHLGDAEAAQLFRTAHRCLRTGGQLITLDNVYVNGQSPMARYLISKDRGRHVREPAQYTDRARPVFSQVDGFIRHDLLRVPYSHFIMKCQKT